MRVFLKAVFSVLLLMPINVQAMELMDLSAAVEDFSEDLNEANTAHFQRIYQNYNMISTVEVVRGDVEKAVHSCAGNNPDMSSDLNNRFSSWNAEVSTLLGEANGQVTNMVVAQDYAAKEKFDSLFKLADLHRQKANEAIEKVPVSTKEACSYLLDKMDETQEAMAALLRATLMSQPPAEPAQSQ